jgi:hypothetical protein
MAHLDDCTRVYLRDSYCNEGGTASCAVTLIGGSKKDIKVKLPHEIVSRIAFLLQTEADKVEQDTIDAVIKLKGVQDDR